MFKELARLVLDIMGVSIEDDKVINSNNNNTNNYLEPAKILNFGNETETNLKEIKSINKTKPQTPDQKNLILSLLNYNKGLAGSFDLHLIVNF